MSRSVTIRLLVGLIITLLAVGGFSWYALRQVEGLRQLQTNTIDRNRQDSLQLLRVQNNLNSLALAMRDMSEGEEPYPLVAYKEQFARLRTDLEDALRREAALAPVSRTAAQQNLLTQSAKQLWESSDRLFTLAGTGHEQEARVLLRNDLQMRQSAVSAQAARLLVQNNEAEEAATAQIQQIHDRVERDIYWFCGAVFVTILCTSLALIYSNRRLFQQLEALSQERRVLANRLITVQEEVLRSVAHELHDEFGQILTAVGSMLGRAEKKGLPPDSPFRVELQEVREIAQNTLEKMRSFSQTLHPTVLDHYGLERALEWYTQQFERQTGIDTTYTKEGSGAGISDTVAIHVYRILQESLTNIARHAESPSASVRVQFHPDRLHLEVQDAGRGMPERAAGPGIGLVAMRERAEMLHGTLRFERPAAGGTLMVLDVPLGAEQTGAVKTAFTATPVPERK
jgi:signal transduction histidine kinase